MDSNIKNSIFEMIDTLIEASEYLITLHEKFDFMNLSIILNDILATIQSIHKVILNSDDKSKKMQGLDLHCESIEYSIKNVKNLFTVRSLNFIDKINFELIPLLQEMKISLYLLDVELKEVYNCKEHNKNIAKLTYNKYIDKSEKRGKYKYDLSILVTAYNKLEYTKLCVESILRYVPQYINYEIILMNHGSTDETRQYFDSISPTKQLNILKNGGGSSAWTRIIEGEYCLCVSNDVIITPNAVENMLKCIKSDEKIGWVVPATPNVSNLQSIDGNYTNLENMISFSLKNNVCNLYRWEQRARLCNPVDLIRSNMMSLKKLELKDNLTLGRFAFPDDSISMVMRKNSYKMMLAKDAYCYHFGSVTLKDEIKKKDEENDSKIDFYTQGRIDFCNAFGIDPWGTGFCWDPNLFQYLQCDEKEHVDVLGINCGIGSNPLKVKESIKENAHNLDVTTYNVTDQEEYILDLKGVSDIAEYVESCEDIENIFLDKKFKYIIFEDKFEMYSNPMKILNDLIKRSTQNGIIAVKINEEALINEVKRNYCSLIHSGEWIIIDKSILY